MERILRSPLGCLLIAVLVFIMFALPRNLEALTTRIVEDGDYAANSILIEKGKSAHLLVGNYSRLGFNHPGPGLLYPQSVSELILGDWLNVVPTPFNAHVAAAIALNALIFGLCASVLRAHGTSFAGVLVFIALLLSYATALSLDKDSLYVPGFLASTWMPYMYFLPFLLFIISASAVAVGSFRALPFFVLSAGLLVHGHVSFVVFVAVIGSLVAVGFILAHRANHQLRASARRQDVLGSALLLLLFAIPILLHTLLSWPGELGKYLAYSSGRPSNSFGAATRFVLSFWSVGTVSLSFLVTALFLSALRPGCSAEEDKPYHNLAKSAVFLCFIASACLVLYAVKGIDDLSLNYVAIFYGAVPPFVVWLALTPTLQRVDLVGGRAVVACSGLLLLAMALGLLGPTGNRYRGSVAVDQVVTHIMAAGDRNAPILIELETPDQWPLAVGVLVNSRRKQADACFVDASWSFLVTRELICRQDQLVKGRLLLLGEPPPASTRQIGSTLRAGREALNLGGIPQISGGEFVGVASGLGSTAARGLVLGAGWSVRESWGVWTVGAQAGLRISASQCAMAGCRLSMLLRPFLSPPENTQAVVLRIDQTTLGRWEFNELSGSEVVRSVDIPKQLVPSSGVLEILLLIESPRSPKALAASNDSRELGLGLLAVRIDEGADKSPINAQNHR